MNVLNKAITREVRRKIVKHLIMMYNTNTIRYFNDDNMSEGEYHMRRELLAEMINDYGCYPDTVDLVEVFNNDRPH